MITSSRVGGWSTKGLERLPPSPSLTVNINSSTGDWGPALPIYTVKVTFISQNAGELWSVAARMQCCQNKLTVIKDINQTQLDLGKVYLDLYRDIFSGLNTKMSLCLVEIVVHFSVNTTVCPDPGLSQSWQKGLSLFQLLPLLWQRSANVVNFVSL